MRFAYADPPYPGQAERLYGEHPDFAGEVDHALLIDKLEADYDGWALSTSVPALQSILPLCSPLSADVRLCAWHRSPRNLNTRGIGWCWEPLIVRTVRNRTDGFVPDCVRIPQPVAPDIWGQKPLAFCLWMFNLMGAMTGDDLDDLFPGSGAVSRAWRTYQRQIRLEDESYEQAALLNLEEQQ